MSVDNVCLGVTTLHVTTYFEVKGHDLGYTLVVKWVRL